MAKTDVQVTSDAEESAVSVPEKQVKEKNIFRVRGMPDIPLLVIILILVGFGLAMVYSASYPWAENDYGNSYYYVQRQLIFTAIGAAAMIAFA